MAARLLLLLVIVGILIPQIIAQECPEGQICPITYPVRSDPGGDTCETAEAGTIREAVREGVAGAIQSQVASRLDDVLRLKYLGQTSRFAADSCLQIKEAKPESESGYYWVTDSDGTAVRVYCDMSDDLAALCGNATSGWMRVANVNMSNRITDPECPGSEFELVEDVVRVCRRLLVDDNGGCNSHSFPLYSIDYGKVCGRVIGYQFGTGDAFQDGINSGFGIDKPYVDGVSLTYGSPRNHIWSFASYSTEFFTVCPCSNGSTETTPGFVGENYFCESGAKIFDFPVPVFTTLFSDDALWDGEDCGQVPDSVEGPCCDGPPWFYRNLDSLTNDDIELRLCSNAHRLDEEVSFEIVELYVQ